MSQDNPANPKYLADGSQDPQPGFSNSAEYRQIYDDLRRREEIAKRRQVRIFVIICYFSTTSKNWISLLVLNIGLDFQREAVELINRREAQRYNKQQRQQQNQQQ